MGKRALKALSPLGHFSLQGQFLLFFSEIRRLVYSHAIFTGRAYSSGFTLIELIVVIAILGVLSVVLVTTIDPLDKINAANDSGVVRALAQFGRANDSYAATHNNTYVGGATVTAALTDLQTAGETKIGAYTAPTGYTVNYVTTAACTTAGANCNNYAFWVTALKSKKYGGPTTGQVYVWANGQGCTKANGTAITATTTCP